MIHQELFEAVLSKQSESSYLLEGGIKSSQKSIAEVNELSEMMENLLIKEEKLD
jgi:hypothetical protein